MAGRFSLLMAKEKSSRFPCENSCAWLIIQLFRCAYLLDNRDLFHINQRLSHTLHQ